MKRPEKVIRILLPLAWIYGLILSFRNFLYDNGWKKSHPGAIRTIVVGNLTAGGTGKTPHVAWLATLLSPKYNVAILSRGYKRKSKGFRWVNPEDHPDITGDEPLELKLALPGIPVAVDSNRLRALEIMKRELVPTPDFVILDDGFQHRSLTPGYSIILTRSDRLLFNDHLLPAGRLREPLGAIKRANAIIVTNAKDQDQAFEESYLRKRLKLSEKQLLLTSTYKFREFVPLTEKAKRLSPDEVETTLVVSGIAGNISLPGKQFDYMSFPDHHRYTEQDVKSILLKFNQIKGSKKMIVTTGKDAVKLIHFTRMKEVPLFSLTREITMEPQQTKSLTSSISNNE